MFAYDVPLETPPQMPFLPRGYVVSFPRDVDDDEKRVFVPPYFVVLLRRRSTVDDDEEDDDGEGRLQLRRDSRRRRSGRRGRRTPGNFGRNDGRRYQQKLLHSYLTRGDGGRGGRSERGDEDPVRDGENDDVVVRHRFLYKKKRERTMSGNARTDEQRVTKYAGDFDDVASSNGEISRIRVTSMARKYRSRKRNDRETHDVRERQTAKRIARGSRVREFVRAMVFGGSVESVWKKHGIIHVDVESMFSHQTTRRRGWSYHAVEFSSGDGDEESRGGVSERVFGTFKA